MSKRTVRLTESELKNIITESVKNIISELDWKTYANAAKKASKRSKQYGDKEYKRAERFSKAASDAFNDVMGYEYDYNDRNGRKRHGKIRTDNTNTVKDGKWVPDTRLGKVTSEYDDDGKLRGNYANYHWMNLHGNWDHRGSAYAGTENDDDIEDVRTHWDAAKSELDNYRKGNYDYTQGKGWHLKDNK